MSKDPIYVQFGCGASVADEWINFDSSLTLRFERLPLVGLFRRQRTFPLLARYGDIVKGLPLRDNSCSGVYCCHVLEHLSLEDAQLALRNTYRILRPSGIFRLVLPNLAACVRGYL